MQMENFNEQEIKEVEAESQNIDKKRKIKIILETALFTLGALLLTSCTPAKADGTIDKIPTLSNQPTVTATSTPESYITSKPTASSTVNPSATPAATPALTTEEIISMLNITVTDEICITSPAIYECTLKDGSKKKLMVCLFRHIEANGDYTMTYKNIFDNEPFATFTIKKEEINNPDKKITKYNDQNKFDIKLIPEFLQSAEITRTYGLTSIPDIYEERGQQLPQNPLLKLIDENMKIIRNDPSKAGDNILVETFPSMEEFARIYIAICEEFEEMVFASDYIEGYVPRNQQKTK